MKKKNGGGGGGGAQNTKWTSQKSKEIQVISVKCGKTSDWLTEVAGAFLTNQRA